MRTFPLPGLLPGVIMLMIGSASCAHAADYTLTLKDHRFSPDPITVPANRRVKLIVKNELKVPAEFESSDLDREQVVEAGSSITVYIGPLDPGKYGYFDDFNRGITGTIIVK